MHNTVACENINKIQITDITDLQADIYYIYIEGYLLMK